MFRIILVTSQVANYYYEQVNFQAAIGNIFQVILGEEKPNEEQDPPLPIDDANNAEVAENESEDISIEDIESLEATAAGAASGGGQDAPLEIDYGTQGAIESILRRIEYDNTLSEINISEELPFVLNIPTLTINPIIVAFDNASFITTPSTTNIGDFSADFNGWSTEGNEELETLGGDQFALLSTRNRSGSDAVTDITTLAGILGVSESKFNDIQTEDAKEGSAIYKDITLKGGQTLEFDYFLATRDPNDARDTDFVFITISGNGQDFIYKITDITDPNLSGPRVRLDRTNWRENTGWLSGELQLPFDWAEGSYRLGFGIVDVGISFTRTRDASMVMFDNIDVVDVPQISGNVIEDGNQDLLSSDPLDATDIIFATTASVTEIRFTPSGSAADYITDNGLGVLGATIDGTDVVIPLPESGADVSFATPEDGYLTINNTGAYTYLSPLDGAATEEFDYTLESSNGALEDMATLTIYQTEAVPPSILSTLSLSSPSETFTISMSGDENYAIEELDMGDNLHFTDVVDVSFPFGGGVTIDDVVQSWLQQDSNVIVQLTNDNIVILEDIGTVPQVGPTPGQQLLSYLEDSVKANVHLSD